MKAIKKYANTPTLYFHQEYKYQRPDAQSVQIDSSNFSGALDSTVIDVQKLAEAVDNIHNMTQPFNVQLVADSAIQAVDANVLSLATTGYVYGTSGVAIVSPTGATSGLNVIGFQGSVLKGNTENINDLEGGRFFVGLGAGGNGGTIDSLIAVRGYSTLKSGVTATIATAAKFQGQSRAGVTIGTATGVHIMNSGGTITKNYGLHIDSISGGITENYAIKTNDGEVYFGDNVILADDKDITQGGTGRITAGSEGFYGVGTNITGTAVSFTVGKANTVGLTASGDNDTTCWIPIVKATDPYEELYYDSGLFHDCTNNILSVTGSVKVGAANAITLAQTGLTGTSSDVTISTTGTGDVDIAPAEDIQLKGVALTSTTPAADINTLTDDSNADGLHLHRPECKLVSGLLHLSPPGAGTLYQFTFASFDRNQDSSLYTLASNVVTVADAGKYQLGIDTGTRNYATQEYFLVSVFVDGALHLNTIAPSMPVAGIYVYMYCQIEVPLTAGQTVGVWISRPTAARFKAATTLTIKQVAT